MDWNDLKLFLVVARLGGLRAASEQAGMSPATLGRRIAALEGAVGQQLFERSMSGYALTPAGLELLRRAEAAEAAMGAITRWSEGVQVAPVVCLSAGVYLAQFLASRIGRLWQAEDHTRFELDARLDDSDVPHPTADIELRHRRPAEAGVGQRYIGRVTYALYAGRNRPNGAAESFIGLVGRGAHMVSARWLDARHGDRIGVRCSDAANLASLAAAGAGLCVLPCLIGDSDPRLVRHGPPIAELSHELWMVTPVARQHEAAVRRIAGRLSDLLEMHVALLAGERPWEEQPDRDA